jgi:homogentisate 1,2-dioxygenase
MELRYQSGFGNHFSTEAVPGALPLGQNSPQKSPLGLYAEQISFTAFTVPRHSNRRTWVYRIQPSVTHGAFTKKLAHPAFGGMMKSADLSPLQYRWSPPAVNPDADFFSSLEHLAGNGDPEAQTGLNFYVYAFSKNNPNTFFYSADGEWVFVPVEGQLLIKTELGNMAVDPREIAVVPRGLRFQVELVGSQARGYVCENMGAAFRLPDLGPIGANGLANPRDFLTPVAAYEERKGSFKLLAKFLNQLWESSMDHSPLDVVAWHGNACPYKYDLRLFNTINTVSYDHPDPSIFTVLTSPSDTPGVANIDFVIFPPRWMVAENTFRPPYFHRNCMSELMGLIEGVYDAKEEGFAPGGVSLHNCMSGHGPDAATFEKASAAELKPHYLGATLAFMFESRYVIRPSEAALKSSLLQKDYVEVWDDLRPHFKRP